VPEEHQIDRLDNQFSKMLDIRNRPKVPDSVLSTAMATIPMFGSSPVGNLLFDSVVGAVGVTDIELLPTPEGKVRIPIAVELSHNDSAAARWMAIGIRWDRAGVTTSVTLKAPDLSFGANLPIAIHDLSRTYLGQTARLYGTILALGAAKVGTLKMAYVELTLGETFPP